MVGIPLESPGDTVTEDSHGDYDIEYDTHDDNGSD